MISLFCLLLALLFSSLGLGLGDHAPEVTFVVAAGAGEPGWVGDFVTSCCIAYLHLKMAASSSDSVPARNVLVWIRWRLCDWQVLFYIGPVICVSLDFEILRICILESLFE